MKNQQKSTSQSGFFIVDCDGQCCHFIALPRAHVLEQMSH